MSTTDYIDAEIIANEIVFTKRLVFVYINRYRCLENVNLNFDPRYTLHYDSKDKTLSVKKNYLPHQLYPDGISSVAAIPYWSKFQIGMMLDEEQRNSYFTGLINQLTKY